MTGNVQNATVQINMQLAGNALDKLKEMTKVTGDLTKNTEDAKRKLMEMSSTGGGRGLSSGGGASGFGSPMGSGGWRGKGGNNLYKDDEDEEGGSSKGSGFGKRIAKSVAGMYIAREVVKGIANTATAATNIYGNVDMTSAQKSRGIVEQLPIIGGIAKAMNEFVDAVNGTTEKLRQNEINQQRMTLAQKESMMIAEQTRVGGRAVSTAQTNLLGIAQNPLSAPRFVDRSSYRGEIAFQEEGLRQAAQDTKVFARQRRDSAKLNVERESGTMKSLDEDRNRLLEKRIRLEEKMRKLIAEENQGNRRKAERDETAKSMIRNEQAIQEIEKQRQQEINAIQERKVELTKAESEVRKANIEQLKTEQQIIENTEKRMTSIAGRLGSLNRGQLEIGKASAMAIIKGGLDNSTPQMVDAARQIIPDVIRKMEEKRGERLAKELGGFFKGTAGEEQFSDFNDRTLAQIRKELHDVQSIVRVEINLDSLQLAREIANEVRKFWATALESIRAESKARQKEFEGGLQEKNNLAGGF